MASILAIVSKKVFEKDSKDAQLGDVLPTRRYTSRSQRLLPLEDGGDLYLVTVRPEDRLWLVGVLEAPRFNGEYWVAEPNRVAVADITHLVGQLELDSGQGIHPKRGGLGMSLQTPRRLSDNDLHLLTAFLSRDEESEQVAFDPDGATRADVRLRDAHRALREGEVAQALDKLLEYWKAHPSVEVSEVIETLGDHIDRGLEPIEGKGKTLHQHWLDVADLDRAADLERLLAALPRASAKQLRDWFRALERFAPDPRLTAPVIRAARRFTSSGAGTARTAAMKLIERNEDGRAIEELLALAVDEELRGRSWLASFISRVEKLAASLDEPPPTPEKDAALVSLMHAEIKELLATGEAPAEELFADEPEEEDDGGLLDAIFEDPTDDPARMVYADWLSERGNPRGEFILLQLKRAAEGLIRAEEDRERVLLENHTHDWLGPLAPVVKDPVFERGFLTEARVEFATEAQRRLIGHPYWATVQRVSADELELLRHPAMRSLRSVDSLTASHLAQWAGAKTAAPIVEATGMFWIDSQVASDAPYFYMADEEMAPHDLAWWERIGRVGALNHLQRLQVEPLYTSEEELRRGAYAWLFDAPLAKQLTHLTLSFVGAPSVAHWLETFAKAKALRHLTLRCSEPWGGDWPVQIDLRLAADDERIEVVLARPFDDEGLKHWAREALLQVFDHFPRRGRSRLVVHPHRKLPKAELRKFQRVGDLLSDRFEAVDLPL